MAHYLIFTWPLRLVPSPLRSAFTHLVATQNSFYINIISFLQFPPRGTKSPPGQRSGAESVRRAGGVKIPVFISISSSNPAPFYPLVPFPTIPSASLRSFSFWFLGVFLFSYITQDVRFVLSSNPIPLCSMVFFSLPHSPPSCDHF